MENGSGIASSNHNLSYRPILAPIKVFRCKYCGRKFLNSRALGGHQNAHKKERTLWVMGLSNTKSLGMVPHALPDKPVQPKSTTKDSFKRFQEAYWRQQMSAQPADQDDLRWPGSFRIDSTDSSHGEDLVVSPQKPTDCVLDLDLRL